MIKAIFDYGACTGLATFIAKQLEGRISLPFLVIEGKLGKPAISFEEIINKNYVYVIGKKGRKRVLSINIDSTNFWHLTDMHHIPTLRIKPQVFFNRCLKGKYNKDDFLNYFSLDSTSYFSHSDYHSLRIEIVEKTKRSFI